MLIRNYTVQLICFFSLLFSPVLSAKQEAALSAGMVNPGYHEQPDWFKNSFLDLDDDIAEASEKNKRLMLFFYQDGCPYCQKLLEDNFSQKSIEEKTRQHFDVVTVNIWGDRDVSMGDINMTEKAFAEQLKVMYTPTLIFFNEDGQPVLRTNGYYHPEKFNAALDFVLGHFDKKESFRSYLARELPAPSSGVIDQQLATLKAPYHFNQLRDKNYQLIMFEQKRCKSCDELHADILSREESKALLQQFDIAVVDMWSDEMITQPDGRKSKLRDWAKQLDIKYAPSLVFLDRNGAEVFRIEAYLKAFHVQSVMDYVVTGAYKSQPNFQRFIEDRAERLRAQGVNVDIMN
ncbi:MAG: thioredoxin fold domain-containing protein [Gammaproteobacteria bacterium]|nr:thioredoxin fold domain-containing protein [Gammaproteobacteria bacterium]